MVDAITISRFPMQLRSNDPNLPTTFYSLFRESRESYGVSRERQISALLDGSSDWKRFDKPWFRRDSLTGVVYRRSPATRLSPDGRVTICIPYKLAFFVAVSRSLFDDACLVKWRTADVRYRLVNT